MEEEKKIASLGYEELNKDIEVDIFGIKFGIGLDNKYLEELRKLQYLKNDKEELKKGIDVILGTGAYDKISNKYREDLGKEIDEFVWIKVIFFLKEQFDKFVKNYSDKFYTPKPRGNRYQRRGYERRYRRY